MFFFCRGSCRMHQGCMEQWGRKRERLFSNLDLRAATGTTCPLSPKAVFLLYNVEAISGYLITAYSCTSLPLTMFVVSKLMESSALNFKVIMLVVVVVPKEQPKEGPTCFPHTPACAQQCVFPGRCYLRTKH